MKKEYKNNIMDLAKKQLRDYRKGLPGTIFWDSKMDLSLDEAYQIQFQVAELRQSEGDTVAGYKVGCIGAGVVEQFGMKGPISGHIYHKEFFDFGCELDSRAFDHLAIEGEMAVSLGENGTITAAYPVIELHNYVFRGNRKTLPELVANNGIHAGVVLPNIPASTPLSRWPENSVMEVWVNDTRVDSGGLWPMAGGPEASVHWLSDHLQRMNASLSPGDMVLTATPLGLFPVNRGDYISVAINGETYVECKVI